MVDSYSIPVHDLAHEHIYFLCVLNPGERCDAPHQDERIAWLYSSAKSAAQIAVYDMRLARLGVVLYPNPLKVHVHRLRLDQIELAQLACVAVWSRILVVLNLVRLDRTAISALEVSAN